MNFLFFIHCGRIVVHARRLITFDETQLARRLVSRDTWIRKLLPEEPTSASRPLKETSNVIPLASCHKHKVRGPLEKVSSLSLHISLQVAAGPREARVNHSEVRFLTLYFIYETLNRALK